jgi:nucleoprotein TPR
MDGDDGNQTNSKSVADLSEVIKYLRREKQIVDTKLQIALQESSRCNVQLEQIQKSLDESRTLLDEVYLL